MKLQKDEEMGYEFARLELLGIIVEDSYPESAKCDECKEVISGFAFYFANDTVRLCYHCALSKLRGALKELDECLEKEIGPKQILKEI